jgi:DNA polymerase-3 subunit delta'
MDGLLLHPRTKAELAALLRDAPQGLLFVAPAGTGKFATAKAWAGSLAANTAISVLEPDEKGTITIEATRTLYQRTRAKQVGWQVVIIDHAEAMSTEAQNAFLKLLEEPRPHVTFILTAPTAEALLPTILSRLQVVTLQPVGTKALTAYAKTVQPTITDQALAQLLFVAHGRPATLAAMVKNPEAFERHKQVMQRAKQLLGATQYDRLATVQELSKDRPELIATLEAMAGMLELQLRRQATAQWLKTADALQECLQRLHQNGNARAQLTHLFMSY